MNNGPTVWQRYTTLACWLAVVLTALFICLRIISYGYLPPGDARRHAAKPFANKPYSQILVMRPEYAVDHSLGWEQLLGALHRTLGWSEDDLLSFEIVSLLLWVLCLPLCWMRRPEAWLAAIMAELIAAPDLMSRFTQARPFLLTEGLLMAFLLAWSKGGVKKPSPGKIFLTSAGFALSVWMHGAWYLWILLPAAFFLAQRWRDGLWLTACWMIGVVTGACLTGHPIDYLSTNAMVTVIVLQEHAPKWLLVGEFQSSTGEFATLLLLTLVYLWLQSHHKIIRPLFYDPVVWMIALGWILGFNAARFWADWGMPAALVWMALQFDEIWPAITSGDTLKRLAVCGLIVLPLYLDSTSDWMRRYSLSIDEAFVEAGDPKLQGWLPDKGGIFYSDSMEFFYGTFYKNPTADWRYMVGFEPALMPPEDLKVYRAIYRNHGVNEAYEPWIKKMRPEDRLAVMRSVQPVMPGLEWIRSGDTWIGRLPRKDAGHQR